MHNRRITLGDTNSRFSREDLNQDKISLLKQLLNEARTEEDRIAIRAKIVKLGGSIKSKKKRG